jgi:hypothetical protein
VDGPYVDAGFNQTLSLVAPDETSMMTARIARFLLTLNDTVGAERATSASEAETRRRARESSHRELLEGPQIEGKVLSEGAVVTPSISPGADARTPIRRRTRRAYPRLSQRRLRALRAHAMPA